MGEKRVVITGTSGLLGPTVAKYFAEQGCYVTGADKTLPKEPYAQENLL